MQVGKRVVQLALHLFEARALLEVAAHFARSLDYCHGGCLPLVKLLNPTMHKLPIFFC
jgi:hypothetical protein